MEGPLSWSWVWGAPHMWSKAPCSRTLAFKLGKADSSSVDVSFDLEWGDLCFFFSKTAMLVSWE